MDAEPEGFVVGNRRIYAARYWCTCGTSMIVWFTATGEDRFGRTRNAADGRAMVTTKAGETLLYEGTPYVVERVEGYRESRLNVPWPEHLPPPANHVPR